MRKTVSITTNVSPALARRVKKSARDADQSISAHVEDMLAFTFYGRGRKAENILDKPKPPHIVAFEQEHEGNLTSANQH